ncbi:macrophage mannose receptor 1-like [Sinocyclocheilus anshuiensis]|uniref:macrophage mannose receptor 1-like n=1 Tax=Sinocyclocheilus anshuiensis TaxID=1608454 RepID=UPI0007B81FEB|nr:PREDICTED: macrophage mannose receptor 1-like [Sinocyclocheilus anshuiensis]
MNGSLFVLLQLSGLFWSSSALSRPYHYINVRMSWPEAQSYCRSKYTDLATVDSMGDVNRLVNIVDAGYSGSVWIGLKKGTQKRWGWSNGENTTSQYYNWDSAQPNGDGDCVATFSRAWHDAQCSHLLYFTCYTGNTSYLITINKNWTDAQSYCRQYYTDLPTIHNSTENEYISKMLYSGWYVWIGLFLDSWEWSDKWILFFRHWAAGQPSMSSGPGDCVGMSKTNSGRWAQYSCDLQSPFICYGSEPSIPMYQFMNQSMTWLDAQRYCRARFTDLAAVMTMNDVRRLVTTVDHGYNGSVWIGLHALGVGRWLWTMGDSAISQDSMWHPGEPSGDGECVRSFNGSWYDESCSTVLPFVCFNDSTGFIINKTAMTWRDAQSYCRQHHTDLASISSPEQQNLISKESSLWIGLFLDSWEWSNQWSYFFRYWAADQPLLSLVSSNCAGMSTTDSGKWAQYSCDLKQPFICYGDDKLIKKQVVRVKLSCNGKCTLNDPSLQTTILNEISKKLKSMGLESDRKLSWRKGQNGEVFHQERKSRASSNTVCNRQ